MRMNKRIIALVLALAGLLGCLSGCGLSPEASEEPSAGVPTGTSGLDNVSVKSQGQYVQHPVSIPSGTQALDMVKLSTGRLRLAIRDQEGNVLICTAGADGNSWETEQLPEQLRDISWFPAFSLSPNGEIFCASASAVEGTDTYEHHMYLVEADGTCREIPITYPDVDPASVLLVTDSDFTDDGQLAVVFGMADVREVDLETGELSENRNDSGSFISCLNCVGESVYMLGSSGSGLLRDGQYESLSGVLGDQLTEAIRAYEGNENVKTALCANAEGYLFFTTHEGIFSYVPGGSVTEELVSGSRTSLGDPAFYARALTAEDDGSFYVLGNYDREAVLYHYNFDEAATTVSEGHIRVYSLYMDMGGDLEQIVSRFQAANPGITVDLEIGIEEEYGQSVEGAPSVSDAIRTLNTQILAGDGPDVLVLDGLSMDAYLEKDLLIDLSQILAQGDPLLEQVTHCYQKDGKVCAVPTSFAVPVVYAPEDMLSQITDLNTLVEAAKQHKEQYQDSSGVFRVITPTSLADNFYDSCSPAWVREDGTLDEEKLTEFYDSMKQLFDLDQDFWEKWPDYINDRRTSSGISSRAGYNTGFSATFVAAGEQTLSVGNTGGMRAWGWDLGGDAVVDGYRTGFFHGQAKNSFTPKQILGILSTSDQQDAAAQFLRFVLSDETQSNSLTYGFPVNQVTFDREVAEDRYLDSFSGVTCLDGTQVDWEVFYPDAGMRQEMKTWVDQLTTPALTGQTIREMVMAQVDDCLYGNITPEEAAQAALKDLNLYLSE